MLGQPVRRRPSCRDTPVASSISTSIAIDSFAVFDRGADSPPVAAGGSSSSDSAGTHANPKGGRSTTAWTPSSVSWPPGADPPGGGRARVGQEHRDAARQAQRIDHQVARPRPAGVPGAVTIKRVRAAAHAVRARSRPRVRIVGPGRSSTCSSPSVSPRRHGPPGMTQRCGRGPGGRRGDGPRERLDPSRAVEPGPEPSMAGQPGDRLGVAPPTAWAR